MNENKAVEVSGFISPLNRYSAVSLKVKAPDVWIDRYLRAAIPSEAQEAVAYFDGLKDADGNAIPLQAHGAFEARVNRPYGLRKKVIVDVDINIDKGDGAYTQFAYPLHEAKGKIFVRPNSVEIKNFTARNGPARLAIDGRVTFGKEQPVVPELKMSGNGWIRWVWAGSWMRTGGFTLRRVRQGKPSAMSSGTLPCICAKGRSGLRDRISTRSRRRMRSFC